MSWGGEDCLVANEQPTTLPRADANPVGHEPDANDPPISHVIDAYAHPGPGTSAIQAPGLTTGATIRSFLIFFLVYFLTRDARPCMPEIQTVPSDSRETLCARMRAKSLSFHESVAT